MKHWTTIRIVGESGEGIVSTGEILSRVLQHAGFHILTFRTYPAEIKGGQCLFQVRFASEPLLTAGEDIHILVCFDHLSYASHISEPVNLLIYNSDDTTPEAPSSQAIGIPLTSLAREELKQLLSKNMVVLGVIAHVLGLKEQAVESVTERWFQGKAESLIATNKHAIQIGRNAAKARLDHTESLTPPQVVDSVILSGNQALVLGALAAECRFVAGYPITPASNILEHMVQELPKFGGIGIQTEDEIAALGACIGASYAGKKAMTATSGPGFSLMHELIGLASMMEIPVVIVDAQRAGPSTGMPTKMEQSDLMAAIHGSHGDAPRVVLAPGTVRECFELTVQAFNISELLRLPVIVLTDLALAQRTTSLPASLFENVETHNRPLQSDAGEEPYLPYALNESGINAIALPGTAELMHVITGLEHDESGTPSYTPELHTTMTEKRHKKLQRVFELYPGFEEFRSDFDASIGVISWGSNYGPIMEALHQLESRQQSLPFLHLKILQPLPLDALGHFADSLDHLVVIENNYTGQLADLLETHIDVPIHRMTGVTGMPFKVSQIVEFLTDIINTHQEDKAA